MAARLPAGWLEGIFQAWDLVADIRRSRYRYGLVLSTQSSRNGSVALGSCQRQERPRVSGKRARAERGPAGSDEDCGRGCAESEFRGGPLTTVWRGAMKQTTSNVDRLAHGSHEARWRSVIMLKTVEGIYRDGKVELS